MPSALHTIETYPFDLAAPVFARYPAMKFGHRGSVSHYADRLVSLALRMIGDAPAADGAWVLTSPPIQGLPCGANLVCRALCGRLADSLPEGPAPRLEEIVTGGPRQPIGTPAEFEAYHDYSKFDVARRRQLGSARHKNTAYDLAGFAGRRVLFVNDINVTGTQLAGMTRLMREAGVESFDALLILQVDPAIGRLFPQLESEINTSGIAGFGDFVAFLSDGDMTPTGKLISRLLSHTEDELAALFAALPVPVCRRLYQAILQEDLYGSPLFGEKLRLAERAAAGE